MTGRDAENGMTDKNKVVKENTYEVAIVGGGAAGCAACVTLAGRKTVLLNSDSRPLRKVAASGNGRCNWGNVNRGCERYRTHDPSRWSAMMGDTDTEEWLHRLGVDTMTDESGRRYPATNKAATVCDALQLAMDAAGVERRDNCEVVALERTDGGWRLRCRGQESVSARYVIVAVGSPAAPQLGAKDNGEWLRRQGLTMVPWRPALVPLKTEPHLPSAKGCRANAVVTLTDGDKKVGTEKGELLWTEYGLSGVAVMQLSMLLEECKHPSLVVDLLPDQTIDEVWRELQRRQRNPRYTTCDKWLVGKTDKLPAYALLKMAGISLNERCADVDGARVKRLAMLLKACRYDVTETAGWDKAQVATGGVALREVKADTLECVRCDGVYLCGEILDVAGSCGGYNLQWAFDSGRRAAENVLRRLIDK